MRTQRTLFTTTALIETGAGLALLGLPALVIRLAFGVREPAHEALMVARVGGAGLLALGVACWLARNDDGSSAKHGLLWAMLVYNVGVCAVLAFAGLTSSMTGVALWPMAGLHAVMAVWCARNLRGSPLDGR